MDDTIIAVYSSVILNNLNPQWNEDYRLEVCHFGEALVFEVRDKDHAYAEFIGSVEISTQALLNGEIKEGWFPIKKKSGSHRGQLNLRVQVTYLALYNNSPFNAL